MLTRALLAVAIAASSLGAAEVASAAEDPSVRVFQRKSFLRRERVEIAPWVGMTVNDNLMQHYYTGVSASYHLSEKLSLGINAAKAFGDETSLFEKVQSDFALNPVVSKVEWLATAEGAYAFLYGKFLLFNSVLVNLDTSAVGGLGASGTSSGSAAATLDVGVLQRFFLARWLTVNVGIKHYMHVDEVRGDSTLFHSTVAMAGISIWAPDFEYKTFR